MMVTSNLSGCWAKVAAQDYGCQYLIVCHKKQIMRTMPAAPPPTMTTFFLPFLPSLRRPSEDMLTDGRFDGLIGVRSQDFIARVTLARRYAGRDDVSHLVMMG